MIARVLLSVLLGCVLIYAWTEYRRSPVVALLSVLAGCSGFYFVWVPDHATELAHFAGIGRGVDLILYVWVVISLILLLNLHLKLRAQMDTITILARSIALAEAARSAASGR